jgi:hypothetical protein
MPDKSGVVDVITFAIKINQAHAVIRLVSAPQAVRKHASTSTAEVGHSPSARCS